MLKIKGIVAVLMCIWIVVVIYFYESTDYNIQNESSSFKKALNQIDYLKQKNDHLEALLSDQNEKKESSHQELEQKLFQCLQTSKNIDTKFTTVQRAVGVCEPTKEQEVLTKQISDNVMETLYFLEKQLTNLQDHKYTSSMLTEVKQQLILQQRSLLLDVEDLIATNDDWRRLEAESLENLIQKRIRYIQNPKSCSTSKRLVCKLDKGCGFGCQIHHLLYCFFISYGTKRTLIIDSQPWRYSQDGWESVFLPVSENCTDFSGRTETWKGENAIYNSLVVNLPIVDGLKNRPPYIPLGIPSDIYDRIIRLHGNPSVWWVGQFLKHLWRPQPWLQSELDKAEMEMNFKNPIVGVHVRRTDKVGTEAAFHSIDEYMKYVDDWFLSFELRYVKENAHFPDDFTRRVYLASDDPLVLPEARKKYPKYEFIGDVSISKSAQLGSRYTKNSLLGIIKDIHFLSKSDYLVCTFSSQVCRLAYELMQTSHPDAANRFHSLDDIYYFGGQSKHEQIARFEHKPLNDKEIELMVGDSVGIAGNHWDGYSKGVNKRTGKTGLYPSYKTSEIYEKIKYPTFSELTG